MTVCLIVGVNTGVSLCCYGWHWVVWWLPPKILSEWGCVFLWWCLDIVVKLPSGRMAKRRIMYIMLNQFKAPKEHTKTKTI